MLAYARACTKYLTQMVTFHPQITTSPWGRMFLFYASGNRFREVICPVTPAGKWQLHLKPVVLTVLFDWLTLEFHSTNCCWRKVKTRLLHQPRVISFSWSPCACAVVLILLGALQFLMQISHSFFFLSWLLKKGTLGWFTAPCSDLLTVFVP